MRRVGDRRVSASGATTGISAAASSAAKRVLLEDLRVAPAAGPVELGDDDPAVLQEDLEDAVLVGVQLQQPAVAAQADAVERVEHRGRA